MKKIYLLLASLLFSIQLFASDSNNVMIFAEPNFSGKFWRDGENSWQPDIKANDTECFIKYLVVNDGSEFAVEPKLLKHTRFGGASHRGYYFEVLYRTSVKINSNRYSRISCNRSARKKIRKFPIGTRVHMFMEWYGHTNGYADLGQFVIGEETNHSAVIGEHGESIRFYAAN